MTIFIDTFVRVFTRTFVRVKRQGLRNVLVHSVEVLWCYGANVSAVDALYSVLCSSTVFSSFFSFSILLLSFMDVINVDFLLIYPLRHSHMTLPKEALLRFLNAEDTVQHTPQLQDLQDLQDTNSWNRQNVKLQRVTPRLDQSNFQ